MLRWNDFIQQFDFGDVKYIPGKSNPVADALSRPPIRSLATLSITPVGATPDILFSMSVADPRASLLTSVRAVLPSDSEFGPVFNELSNPSFNAATHKYRSRYVLDDGVLYWVSDGTRRLCLPHSLRANILHDHHAAAVAGHFGIDKTYAALRRSYYWRYMYEDVRKYVSSCTSCQSVKARNLPPAGLARVLAPPSGVYERWGLDFVLGLPPAPTGENCLVVFIDHLSKKTHIIPAVSSSNPRDSDNPLSAEKTAQIYFNHIFRHYGLPLGIVSDRDSRFVSKFWQELHRLCGTKLFMSTAFHPQSDGLTERMNRTIVDGIHCALIDLGGHWFDHIISVEFAINNAVQASTGMSPFFMTQGRHPRLPTSIDASECTVPAVGTLLETLTTNIARATDAILRAQIPQIDQIDSHRRVSPFQVGDRVYLSSQHLSFSSPAKFTPRWIGPFTILELSAGGNAARLCFKDYPDFLRRNLHPVFNVSLLRPFIERPSDMGPVSLNRPPPLEIHDDVEYFEVDHIVTKAMRGRGSQRSWHYLVRWKGYGPHEDSWEPAVGLQRTASDAVRLFEDAQSRRLSCRSR